MTGPRVVVAYGIGSAHDLLRAEAARLHHVAVERIVLGHECDRCGSDDHGRPRLLPTASVRHPAHVSLARAGDLSVVALTAAGPVGIDVEATDAAGFTGFDDVALHADESVRTAAERTRLWVRKEALLKAYGLGLAVDPRDVLIDDGTVTWDSPLRPPGTVRLLDVDVPGHVSAVAVVTDAGPGGLSVTVRAASS